MRIVSVIATASETKREARIGSSAVENQCDEGALDFQGPDERSDIGIG